MTLGAVALSGAIAADTNGDGYEDLAWFDSNSSSWKLLHGSIAGLAATPLDRPVTSAGVSPTGPVLLPSSPYVLVPQHFTPPPVVSAQV